MCVLCVYSDTGLWSIVDRNTNLSDLCASVCAMCFGFHLMLRVHDLVA